MKKARFYSIPAVAVITPFIGMFAACGDNISASLQLLFHRNNVHALFG